MKIQYEANSIKTTTPGLLFKFDYWNNFHKPEETKSIDLFKDFMNMFSSTAEVEEFLNEVFYTLTYEYAVLKTMFYYGIKEGKYDEKETDNESYSPVFDKSDLYDVTNIDDYIKLVKESGKRGLYLSQLNRFKKYMKMIDKGKEKYQKLMDIVENGVLYLVSNKNKFRIIDAETPLISRILNEFVIEKKDYGSDGNVLSSIREFFIQTKRNKKPKGTMGGDVPINELSFVHKGLVLSDSRNRFLVEESRKKLISVYDKLSINFVSIISDKKFKQKGVQNFELLDDEDKMLLMESLKI